MSGGDAAENQLIEVLQASYANDKQARDAATEYLMNNSGAPGLAPSLINIIAASHLEDSLRQSAAANLYSLVQRSWNPDESPYPPIPQADQVICKARIVPLMLEVPKQLLFKSVSGTLQVMSAHEFPHNWAELMPQLVERLQSDDPHTVIAILKTMNSVLKYYRTAQSSSSVVADLLAILKDFAAPLKQLLEAYSAQFDSYQGNVEVITLLLTMIKLIWDIFLSLTAVDLPQVFLDELPFWMEYLKKYLVYDTPNTPELLHSDDDTRAAPGAVTKVHASVIRVLNQFVKKYDEDVEPYVQPILQDVWMILQRVGSLPNEVQLHYDTLVIEALNFLSTAITGVHHTVFESEELLTQIATLVILPNIRLTVAAFESFEFEPLDYLRSDLEGSDSLTRRRAAIDLVKSMRRYFEESITKIFSGIVGQLLSDYAQNVEENWHLKDSAIYLIIALAATSQTRVKGVVATNSLINLSDFFESSVYPELNVEAAAMNERPVVKADCLRFTITFRRQLSAEQLQRMIPLMSMYLTAESTVVATYAAIGLEAFMTMKQDQGAGINQQLSKIPSSVWETHMPSLFTNLFARIGNPSATRFESENPYVGAAIARLITAVGAAIVPLAQTCLDSLTSKLAAIYKNPSSSIFVHCIFEGIAGVIQALIKNNRPELCEAAEITLLPAFQSIFAEEITDLIPYVYQLMAQLIEAKKSDAAALWKRYGEQFQGFTTATHWERFANIPALTRLLSAYIRFAPTYVSEYVLAILGIFGRVNELKSYEKYGFRLILDLMLSLERTLWLPQAGAIFDRMLKRLQSSPTYQNHFIIFISNLCFAPSLGPEFVMETLLGIGGEEDLFAAVLSRVVIVNMGRSPDFVTVVGGLVNLLVSQSLLQRYANLFVPLLDALVNLTVGNKQVGGDDLLVHLAEQLSMDEKGGHADFAKLNFSGQSELFVVPRDLIPQQYLISKLVELSNTYPGTVPSYCAELPEQSRNALAELLAAAGATLA